MTKTQGLDPTIKAGIEADFKAYKRRVARLKTVLEELRATAEAFGSHKAEVSQKHRRPSNPTLRAVLKRERLIREAEELERMVYRVGAALQAMTEQQRRLVEMYYIEGVSRAEIEAQLGVSTRQFWRIRDEAFEVYAYVAGLVQRSA